MPSVNAKKRKESGERGKKCDLSLATPTPFLQPQLITFCVCVGGTNLEQSPKSLSI